MGLSTFELLIIFDFLESRIICSVKKEWVTVK